MLKNQDWHCFEIPNDNDITLDVDYLITGVDPERVNFEARQRGTVLASREQARSAQLAVESKIMGQNIELCWQKTDRKSKKLDLAFKRNQANSDEAADINTLDSLVEDLKLL